MTYVIDPEEPVWVRKVLPVPKKPRPWNGMIKKKTRKCNPRVWGETPPTIQALIANFLPLPSLCRFKTVSKQWRSAINQCIVPKQEWYIRIGHSCVYLLDGMAKRPSWRRLSLHIPRNLTRISWSDHNTHVVSVCGLSGLILIHSNPLSHHGFVAFVCNPFMLNGWVQLPPPPQVAPTAATIIYLGIQEVTLGEFIVVCLRGHDLTDSLLYEIVVYNSKQANWVSSKSVPASLLGGVVQRGVDSMVLKEDKITFITVSENGLRSLKSLSIWDPSNILTLATWITLPLNMYQSSYHLLLESRNYTFPGGCQHTNRLVFAGGKFVVVNWIPVPMANERVTVGFLFLNDNNEWQVLASLPPEKLPCGLQEELTDVRVRAGGGEQAITFYLLDIDWGGVYDMGTAAWRFVCGRSAYGDGDAFYPFQPSFTTF